jgi:FKBP-type peptidyl-prolyl cis-trans isomerase 2
MARAQEGDTVTITYWGTLEDGSFFDASDEGETTRFVLGDNEVIPGLERAIAGMEVGERKTVTIPPEEAYGIRLPRLVEEVSLEALPDNLDLQAGNQLEVESADGTLYRMIILERGPESVLLDANHPLAGQTLTFRLELLEIDRPTLN